MDDLSANQFCYLTTTGRRTGRAHEIEIWFGMAGGTLYMLSGGGEKSDWVANLLANPSVNIRISERTFDARARVVTDSSEHDLARRLLLEKYEPTYAGDLQEWGATALPIAVDLAV